MMMAAIPLGLVVAASVRDRFENDAYTAGMIDQYALYFLLCAALFTATIVAAWWLNRKARRGQPHQPG